MTKVFVDVYVLIPQTEQGTCVKSVPTPSCCPFTHWPRYLWKAALSEEILEVISCVFLNCVQNTDKKKSQTLSVLSYMREAGHNY